MERRSFLRNTALLAGGSLLFQRTALAAFFQTYAGNLKMLRNNVGIYTERGGTIGFFLSDSGHVVIDSQFPDTASNFIEAAHRQNSTPPSYLLNTHHHSDHTGGNISFKGLVSKVIAHENAAANLKMVAEKAKTLDKQFLPNTTFSKKLKLKTGGEKIRGHYFGAAHTNGDAVYHFQEANIMHVGDLMFNKRHPFVDRSTGANMRNWIDVLNSIYKKADKDTLIIFGHSLTPGEETGTREDLKKFGDYLGKVLDFAEAEIKKGVTKEAFVKNTSIPGVTEWSGQGIERPLTAAYEELTAGKS